MKSAKKNTKNTSVKPLKLPNAKKERRGLSYRRDPLLHHTIISLLAFDFLAVVIIIIVS
jgi:hypothetical protein